VRWRSAFLEEYEGLDVGWFVLIAAVLVALAGATLFLLFNLSEPSVFVTLIVPVVSVTFTLVLFLGFLFTLVRLLRLTWARAPATVWSLDAVQTDKAFAALLSLAIFPKLALYAWETVQSIIRLFPELIRLISGFQETDTCSRRLGSDALSKCASELATELARGAQQFAAKIIEALNLERFPIGDFVWFLASTLVLVQVIAIVRQRVGLGDAMTSLGSGIAWLGGRIALIPTVTWQRIVFTAIVVTSFYLGLTALLAIPLLDDKTQSQHTADAVGKALQVYLIKAEVFDTTFPPQLAEIRPPSPAATLQDDAPASPTKPFMKRIIEGELDDLNRMRGQLQGRWTGLRTAAQGAQLEKVQTASNNFQATLDKNLGKRHTDRYYYDLLNWFSGTMGRVQSVLSRCQSGATQFIGTSSQLLGKLYSNLEQTETDFNPVFRDYYSQRENLWRLQTDILGESCVSLDLPQAPTPPTIAAGLGDLGTWTKWLIDTERMPVVIIVGLVGFSLLGATVSRAVRVQTDDRPRAAFTLDDLLTVIAGGTTAAVVVFLAAYGGLAVLGNSSGDPNPYIVFATCLIAAVYSEDVWTWARRRLLATELAGRNTRNPRRTKRPRNTRPRRRRP
jgi:hypothetical protein